MCRQIFTFKQIANGSLVEYANLKTLIDGHRVMRERLLPNNELEFEAFDAEGD